MGTDIHTWIQVKNDNGEWETLNLYTKRKGQEDYKKAYSPLDYRNYALFGKLAGLRTWEDAIVPERGWPKDITEDIQEEIDYYGNYLFSSSWVDFNELVAISKTPDAISHYYDEEEDGLGDNVILEWIKKIIVILDAYDIYSVNPGECRIVFAFDC